jgi:hypothetical protein
LVDSLEKVRRHRAAAAVRELYELAQTVGKDFESFKALVDRPA